jgi:protein-disulfide isomerase
MKIRLVSFFAAFLALASVVAATLQPSAANAQAVADSVLSGESVLRDPDIPVLGNPRGDITIVEYFDYRCPYCKKVNPDLQQVVRDDGQVRLVFKDWPIFGEVSIYAARLALAAKYQNKHAEAHEALIAIKGTLTEANVQATLAQAGIDVDVAMHDLATNRNAIDALLARNHAQAVAFGFQGTPAFIIGHFRVPGALDAATFKQAIADARAAQQRK